MTANLTIQEAAQLTGLSKSTLRYYEQIGLIPQAERDENQHRRYSDAVIRRIEFVKKLRSTSMPVSDVQRYVMLLQGGESTYAERLEIMKSHREKLATRIEELTGFLERIDRKIDVYSERVAN